MKNEIKIPSSADTKIAKSSTLSGNLEVIGTLLISGRVEGNIISHDDIYIGKTAVINGDVTAKNAYIFGVVQGNVVADGSVYLATSSKLFGNIKSQSFVAEKGSTYKGTCETSENAQDMEKIKIIDDEKKFGDIKEGSVIENL